MVSVVVSSVSPGIRCLHLNVLFTEDESYAERVEY